MSKIWYNFSSYGGSSGGYDPEDSWSRDSTWTVWSAPSFVTLQKDGSSETDEIAWQPTPGDAIFCLWAQWSTGDTFGHDSGSEHEVIGWYKDYDTAAKAFAILEADLTKPSDYGDGIEIPNFDGSEMRKVTTYSWKGYFESLDKFEIQPMVVRG